MKIDLKSRPVLRDLGDGLILCRSIAADAAGLAEFNARIHSDKGFDKPDERIAAWTRDLLTHPHPTFSPEDFTLVVEAASGKIISSLNLISQTWAYAGVPFPAGRPELVGTLPEYRNRGLVRVQFDEIHKWSAERGEQVLGITGIPFYYKLFGYEMGLELGGGRVGFEAQLPKLKDGEQEPFFIRPAAEADIPFLMEVYALACQRRLVTCIRDEGIWRYDLSGQSKKNVIRHEIRIIARPDGEPVGYLTHPWFNWDAGLVAQNYELRPGISWLEVTPSVARYLWAAGGQKATRENPRSAFGFWFGTEHPSYAVFRDRLPRVRDPYAWYVRVPDLPRFMDTIAPVLERRLAGSPIVGYTGETRISFYRSGLKLVFEKGQLTGAEAWQPAPSDQGTAAFPDLSFLQLVFGYRSFEELEQSYADCWYRDDEARLLLDTLFPKQASSVMFVS
ncbi:MAG: GNAT family N-acetyltransferase [Anaerolineales bacterium]|nr:GNAT family N-acetyltransferase [Anaerolineales bacterium]